MHKCKWSMFLFCVDGSVCIEKTSFVEKLEREQIKECWHQNITACHFSSVTEFKSMQQKKCEENTYHKTCKINFKEVALNYTVRTCHKPLVQQCSYRHHNQVPVTKCRTWFETTCNTTLVVDAYGSPKGGQQVWCEKIPKKICAPDHCAMVEGNCQFLFNLTTTTLNIQIQIGFQVQKSVLTRTSTPP